MKPILLVVAVLGLTGFASGQTQQNSLNYSPSTHIMADDFRFDATSGTVYARGAVRIVSESSTITADEADLHHQSDSRTGVDLDIQLRGNVHVVIAPAGDK